MRRIVGQLRRIIGDLRRIIGQLRRDLGMTKLLKTMNNLTATIHARVPSWFTVSLCWIMHGPCTVLWLSPWWWNQASPFTEYVQQQLCATAIINRKSGKRVASGHRNHLAFLPGLLYFYKFNKRFPWSDPWLDLSVYNESLSQQCLARVRNYTLKKNTGREQPGRTSRMPGSPGIWSLEDCRAELSWITTTRIGSASNQPINMFKNLKNQKRRVYLGFSKLRRMPFFKANCG